MRKLLLLHFLFFISAAGLLAQSAETGLSGNIIDENQASIAFANETLFASADSSTIKVGYSQDDGSFSFTHLDAGE